MPEFRGEGEPLPRHKHERWWPIRGVKGAEKLRVVILGHTYRGYWTHWDGNSFLCNETPDCRGCKQSQTRKDIGSKWQGYIAAYENAMRREVVLSLTKNLADHLVEIGLKKGTLRGARLVVFRERPSNGGEPSNRGKLICAVEGWEPSEAIAKEFPIHSSVMRAFGVNGDFMDRGGWRLKDGPPQKTPLRPGLEGLTDFAQGMDDDAA